MKLPQLLAAIPHQASSIPDLEITGIQEDSRLIQPGHLFIAKSGVKTSGTQYLADAAARGALAAIVSSPDPSLPIPQIPVPDPAAAISPLADAFYDHPSQHLRVIGITGTNGKTTTTYLTRHILAKSGKKCGLIGTVHIDDGHSAVESTMTTPSPIDVARLLAAMRQNACAACAIEVSSHALDQFRVGAIHFAAAAFTNLSGDHLDYHKTMDNYAAAKARLFQMLPPSAAAIVNARDPASPRIVRDTPARVLRFAANLPADYRATDIHVAAHGTSFTLHTPLGHAPVHMPLIGLHNVENALTAAASVMEVFSLSPDQIALALRDALGAPGRLQPVTSSHPFTLLVDYAHTDDALANVLTALRPLTSNKLRVLFGCGGDRDGTKRPRMAAVAQRLADAVYLTSDNPRTENPDHIIAQVLVGFSQPSPIPIVVEPDRRAAIARIIHDAQPGDILLLAGKGHENYQIIGSTKHHFDDVEEALQVLK